MSRGHDKGRGRGHEDHGNGKGKGHDKHHDDDDHHDHHDGHGHGAKVLTGTGLDDVLIADPFHVKINGGDGDDTITGNDLDNRINAGDGDDVVEGGAGDDRMHGNDGIDTAVFDGSVADYDFEVGKGGRLIVTDLNAADGDTGTDTLKHFEFLKFNDFTIDLSAFDPNGNNAPLANPAEASVGETPEAYSADSAGAGEIIPNYGRFYYYDFDTGTAGTVARDGGANNTFDQIAASYLSDGNGIIVQVNPDSVGWGVGAYAYSDGTGAVVDPSDFVVTGANGAFDDSGPESLVFADATTAVDAISLTVSDFATPNGSVDFTFTINDLIYGTPTTDSNQVGSVDFQSILTGEAPEVLITPEVLDLEGDTLVFSVDTTGTLGSVVNNNDGSFTYSADGQFEYLDDGESATDSFSYTATDEHGRSTTETITVTINGADDFAFV